MGDTRLSPGDRSMRVLTLMVVAVSALVVTGFFVSGGLKQSSTSSTRDYSLPSGCVKPVNGFLLITTSLGWNSSLKQGLTLFPVISVGLGQNVTIVVCNVDTQSHGFQINHYFDKQIVSDNPGKVIRVSFVADKAGSFAIYCDVFCTIHPEMIGQLNVSQT